MKQLSNFSSPANLSPTPLSEYAGINTSTRYDDGTANAGYLILVPIAILVFIVITVLGTYKWQNRQEQSSPSLCQVLRRRVIRSCSPRQLRTQTNNSAGHIVTQSSKTLVKHIQQCIYCLIFCYYSPYKIKITENILLNSCKVVQLYMHYLPYFAVVNHTQRSGGG